MSWHDSPRLLSSRWKRASWNSSVILPFIPDLEVLWWGDECLFKWRMTVGQHVHAPITLYLQRQLWTKRNCTQPSRSMLRITLKNSSSFSMLLEQHCRIIVTSFRIRFRSFLLFFSFPSIQYRRYEEVVWLTPRDVTRGERNQKMPR